MSTTCLKCSCMRTPTQAAIKNTAEVHHVLRSWYTIPPIPEVERPSFSEHYKSLKYTLPFVYYFVFSHLQSEKTRAFFISVSVKRIVIFHRKRSTGTILFLPESIAQSFFFYHFQPQMEQNNHISLIQRYIFVTRCVFLKR